MKSSLDSAILTWPVRVLGGGARAEVTQEFKPGVHLGVDIAVRGHYHDAVADVLAVARGTVVRAARGPRGGYVLIDHGDYASSYLHLQAPIEVRVGEVVEAGRKLGRMGADPLDAERIVHLHFQIAPGGTPVDPEPYLPHEVA